MGRTRENTRLNIPSCRVIGRALMLAALTACLVGGAAASAQPDLSDEAITEAVEKEFSFDSAVPFNDIDVTTNGGIVTLKGSVNNILSKDRASDIAGTVRGVRAVVNQIEVEPAFERSDKEVKRNVITALLLDPATEAYEVTVDVAGGGVVTLEGSVNSWQEKQLCETVAKGAAGVTAVNNNIVVDFPTDRADAEIKPEVERRLRWDVLVDDGLIEVAVHDGKVSLNGTVGSTAEKNRARWDAWVTGVKSVDVSNLNVALWARDDRLRTNKYVHKSDAEVRGAVEDALLYDPRVCSFEVTPKVSSGVVTLEGIVNNLRARRAAEQDAKNTVGVLSVENRIKIRPVSAMTDPTIARNVREAFRLDPIVERYDITVDVLSGVVHLYGTVDTYFEKMRAEEVGRGTDGVIRVRSHLSVDFNEPFTQSPYVYPYWWYSYPVDTRVYLDSLKDDEQIEKDIRTELWWSPFVSEDDVTVTVEDGVATLRGTVGSWREYQAAKNNALEGGAVRVVNMLQVK